VARERVEASQAVRLDYGKDPGEILTQRRLMRLLGWEIERGRAI
jgi:hypothetical protein